MTHVLVFIAGMVITGLLIVYGISRMDIKAAMELSNTFTEVIAQLKAAQRSNNSVQALYEIGSPGWHMCEDTDDRLHAALELLGD